MNLIRPLHQVLVNIVLINNNNTCTNNPPVSKNELEVLKGFHIAHLNIASLPTKYIDQLQIHLVKKPVDIFMINESRLDESISDAEVSIQGYNLYKKDRCRSGGGVAIYTRDVLNVRERSQFVPKDIEAVCLQIV